MFKHQKTYIDLNKFLNEVDQLEVWRWCLNMYVNLGEYFTNPLRDDQHPGCWLSWGIVKSDYIVLNDFGDNRFHGINVIEAVQKQYNVNFYEALKLIQDKFNKVENLNVSFKKRKKSTFEFILNYMPNTKNGKPVFIQRDKEFWEPLDISSKQLTQDNVFSVFKYNFNTKTNPNELISVMPSDPTFAYHFHTSYHKKIYRPYQTDFKWITDCKPYDVGGINKLAGDDTLIITKSYKDYRILKNFEYDVIWVQSENTVLPHYMVRMLSNYYNHIIIFYDNDFAGTYNALKHTYLYNWTTSKKNFSYITLPQEVNLTDTADYYLKYGRQKTRQTIKELVDTSDLRFRRRISYL